MKYFILFFSFIIFSSQVKSQCFEIQSILVDACAGSQEGQNEMVTFQVGTSPLLATNLTVNWPNNSWLGLTKNASTALDVATVNSTILGCGFLKEPTANVLPANAKVLLVTSSAWTPLAQSFANLTDTLYIIFQTAGNTAGHFANYASGGGLRTLSMTFSSPSACTDAVTYDRGLLVNQAGNLGAQDGGTVEFSATGVPTYVNNGCQAPFIPLSVDAGNNSTICFGGTQNYTATVTGAFTSVNWSLGAGATGTFTPANSLTTSYVSGAGDNGAIKLYCTILKACGSQSTTVKDSVLLTITPIPTVTISPSVVSICAGQSAIVQANSNTAVTYTWSTSANSNTVSLNSAGIYTVDVSNSCGSANSTVSVSISASPTLSISSSSTLICGSGQTATLSLTGSTGTYTWSNGGSASATTINTSGVYSATVSASGCGIATASISIGTIPLPTVSISVPSTSVCSGSSLTFTASSSDGNYLWSGGATTQTASVSTSSIVVTTTNTCGSAQATQTLDIIPFPTVTLSTNTVSLCSGQSATVQANSNAAVTYSWSTSATTNTVSLNSTGVYSVEVSNICGIATATVNVSSANLSPLILTSSSNTICPNETATLTVTGGDTGIYSWSNSSNTGSVVTTSGGIVSVASANTCGTVTTSLSVSVINLSASISANPVTGTSPLNVSFMNNSSSASTYLWDFGNGNFANTQNVGDQTYNTGIYTVYLAITDGACMDVDSITITVNEVGPTLYVPNAFTPNGDSINDVFLVGATNIKEFNIIIFDRWGLKMFESSDIRVGWDGKVNGNIVADGTYFHLINAVGNDGEEIKKQGTITLFK
jgi:gliding motility-associated-like protein